MREMSDSLSGRRPPTGIVTFLFTDIEGSTRLWQDHADSMARSHARHNDILRSSIQSNGGYIFQEIGDAFCVAFHAPGDALRAALTAQNRLSSETWGEASVRVRMAIHTGKADLLESGDYQGYLTLSLVQRLMSAGHGGQTLVSAATHEIIHDLPPNAGLRDLGLHRLKDVVEAERIYQLVAPTLPSDFPKLRTADARPSIAVLPFIDISADADNEYFCDGLAEELITALTKVEQMFVVARPSAFAFKGKTMDAREIGRQLNVEHILEGSVRKASDNLRITVRLVKVADGYHLWSERFDRKMADIFDVQDEIALATVEKLKVGLLGKERVALLERYQSNLEA